MKVGFDSYYQMFYFKETTSYENLKHGSFKMFLCIPTFSFYIAELATERFFENV